MNQSKTMTGVRCYSPGDYRWEELPRPDINHNEILTRVLIAGICAGDAKAHAGAARMWGAGGTEAYVETPVVPGHEFVGNVVEIGDGAAEKHGLVPGDLVVAEQILPCGECRFCRRGQYWLCQPHDVFGFKRDRAEGAWAEYMKYPANALVHKLPKDGAVDDLVMVEPLACAIHAVERADVQFGDVVVIAGMGPLGLCMLQVARLKNPGLLIALDLNPHRVELAHALGADLALDPSQDDVIARVLELTDGYGCDVYIEASGAAPAVDQGLQMIIKGGRFIEFSVMSEPATVDWSVIGDEKEIEIRGVSLSPFCYPKAIDMITRGLVDVKPIVTHKLPLADALAGLELVHSGEGSIKVALVP